MKTDSFIHRFFREFKGAFFELLGEDASQAERYEFISVEVKEQAFRFDGVFRPDSASAPLFFFEAQFQLEDDFYLRFFAEIAIYLRQKKPLSPWRAVVIFPTHEQDAGIEPHYHEFFDNGRLRRLYLNELPKEALEKFPLNLFRIILDSEQKALTTAQTLVRQLPEQSLSAPSQEAFISMLINLLLSKLPQMSRKEIEKMLTPMLSDVRKSRFYQEVEEELTQELTPKLTQELTPRLTQELMPQFTQEGKLAEKREIAATLLRKKMSLKFVSDVTGLSPEEVRMLKKAKAVRA